MLIGPRSTVGIVSDYGVASSILAQSHTFLEIDHEIISMAILPSSDSFKNGDCQLQVKVSARSTD